MLSAAFSSGNDEKRIPDVSISLPRVRLGRCTRVNSTLVYARYKLYTVTAAVTAPTMETLIYNAFARWNRDGPGKSLNLMDREIASQRYRPRTCMCRALWKSLAWLNFGERILLIVKSARGLVRRQSSKEIILRGIRLIIATSATGRLERR